jgi:CDP-2,3-bis-(O-geranylgeranyl)-sn-glycerol synthase
VFLRGVDMNPVIFYLLQCIYLMLPGIFANMAPVFVKDHFKQLAMPVDFGRKIGKKRLFGNNKTVRGVLFGILFAVIIAYIQLGLYKFPFFRVLSFFDYGTKWFYVGFLMGLGVMFGDLLNSFVKRRKDLKPGAPFIPFDQLNAAVGVTIFILPAYVPSILTIIVMFSLSFVLHIGFNLLGYWIGLKKNKL